MKHLYLCNPRFLILSLKFVHQCHSGLPWDKSEQNSHSSNSQGLKNIWTAETWCALDLAVVRSQCVNGHLCSGVKKGQGGPERKKSENHPSEAAKKRQGMSHSCVHSSPTVFSSDAMRNYPGLTPTGKTQRSPSEECKSLHKAHRLSEESKALHKIGNYFDDSIWLAIPELDLREVFSSE